MNEDNLYEDYHQGERVGKQRKHAYECRVDPCLQVFDLEPNMCQSTRLHQCLQHDEHCDRAIQHSADHSADHPLSYLPKLVALRQTCLPAALLVKH